MSSETYVSRDRKKESASTASHSGCTTAMCGVSACLGARASSQSKMPMLYHAISLRRRCAEAWRACGEVQIKLTEQRAKLRLARRADPGEYWHEGWKYSTRGIL